MLRIHFDSEDLMRVRLASGPDPLWEAMLSAYQVNLVGGPLVFREWRSRVLSALSWEARAYLRLAPQREYTPDVLRPADATADLDEGLGTVLSRPTASFRDELALFDRNGLGRQGETRRAADLPGSAGARRRLARALRAYHDQAIAPYWPELRCDVDAEIAARTRSLTSGGTAALLASMHPSICWRQPVLSIDTRADHDLYLEGRGLTLQPAFFCWRARISMVDPDLTPVLVYPVPHRRSWLQKPGTDQHERTLAALLGKTRAAVLVALTYGASTNELASRIGVSPPSASEHAAVLRGAGLVTSRRERNNVRHTLTPLGSAMLDGGLAQPVASEHLHARSQAMSGSGQ